MKFVITIKKAVACFTVLFFSWAMIAMDQVPKIEIKTIAISGSEGEKKAIEVPLHIAKLSKTITSMIEDMGGDINAIGQLMPIPQFSVDIMSVVFGQILLLYGNQNFTKKTQALFDNFSLDKAIEVIKLLDYLDVPQDILYDCKNFFLRVVKKAPAGEIALKSRLNTINRDLMDDCVYQAISCLKSKIMQRWGHKRFKSFAVPSNDFRFKNIAFTPDATKVVVVSDGSSKQRDTELIIMSSDMQHKETVSVPLFCIYGLMDISLDGKKVAVGSGADDEHFVGVYDINTKEMKVFEDNKGRIESIQFSPDSKKIICGSKTNLDNLVLYDVYADANVDGQKLKGHNNTVYFAKFSPDGTKIISGSEGNQNNLIVWDAKTGKRIASLGGHVDRGVYSVEFSSDGSRMISSALKDQSELLLWDMNSYRLIEKLKGHTHAIVSMAFSPDSSRVVSGSLDNQNNLIMWNARTGELIKILNGHPSGVQVIKYSPDGAKIVSGSGGKENNLILWDAHTGDIIKALDGHEDYIDRIEFSSDGTKVISQSYDNQIVHDANTGELIVALNLTKGRGKFSCTSDMNKVALIGLGQQNFVVCTLISDDEQKELDAIQQLSLQDILLLHALCNAQTLEPNELELLKKFPDLIQRALQ